MSEQDTPQHKPRRIYSEKELDDGTIAVLVEEWKQFNLPRSLRLLEDVRNGGRLSDYDIFWLRETHDQQRIMRPLVERHPEWGPLIAKSISIYLEIIEKGLANDPKA